MHQTVKSAFSDEKVKQEVIVSRVPEEDKDNEFMTDLCNKIEFTPKPKALMRLGQRHPGRCRPIKSFL